MFTSGTGRVVCLHVTQVRAVCLPVVQVMMCILPVPPVASRPISVAERS